MRTIERQLRARQTVVSLNEKELSRLMKATFDTPRLEQVRDLFIFSSFTGLHYQNLKSLRKENFHNKYGQKWIFMVREQTDAFIHIPLLPVPQMILEKYKVRFAGTDELLPVPSNQRLNVYLKEIAELCGIEKNMTMYRLPYVQGYDNDKKRHIHRYGMPHVRSVRPARPPCLCYRPHHQARNGQSGA